MSDQEAMLTQKELQDFISKAPLYKKLRRQLPDFINEIAPDVAFINCPNCRVERPFRDPEKQRFLSPLRSYLNDRKSPFPGGGVSTRMSGIYNFYFLCSGCGQSEFYCLIDVNYEEMSIRKVGQNIPWSISLSPELENDLGNDADLYKKALTLISQSYGIGACAYLRRMVENQINPLLQALYEIKTLDNADSSELQQITEAIRSKNFTTKTEMAVAILPPSIIVGGENPLKLVHDKLSASLHGLTEEEAIDIAVKVKAGIEYLIVELWMSPRLVERLLSKS